MPFERKSIAQIIVALIAGAASVTSAVIANPSVFDSLAGSLASFGSEYEGKFDCTWILENPDRELDSSADIVSITRASGGRVLGSGSTPGVVGMDAQGNRVAYFPRIDLYIPRHEGRGRRSSPEHAIKWRLHGPLGEVSSRRYVRLRGDDIDEAELSHSRQPQRPRL